MSSRSEKRYDLRISGLRLPVSHTERDLRLRLEKAVPDARGDFDYRIVRRSLDARKKPSLFYEYVIDLAVRDPEKALLRADKRVQRAIIRDYAFPFTSGSVTGAGDAGSVPAEGADRPVIIGFGPAGIFAALMLARAGFRPVVFERGKDADSRQEDVKRFWETGVLQPDSNVQFGEGGAGAFSDGKLNSLVKDRDGRNRFVLKTFTEFGAPQEILYDRKPHIGTDILTGVLKRMRGYILSCGGEVFFESCVTDLLFEEEYGKRRVCGVRINGEKDFLSHAVLLCIGHSARDTFRMLYERGIAMESRPFAVGLRIEHPVSVIDKAQYGDPSFSKLLGASAYKLTHNCADGRGVYTFCMCPGGYIVNASSEEGGLCVNGMSYSGRSGEKSNSAVIVTVTPEDYASFCETEDIPKELAGHAFQRMLERKAYLIGDGAVPTETFGEYRNGRLSLTDDRILSLRPQIKGSFRHAPVHEILPEDLRKDIIEGIEAFGRKIPGFSSEDAILAGVEARTSSPVRILRDERFISSAEGLFPVGEGAGYAGGIMSAAIDGIMAAEKLLSHEKDRLRKKHLALRDALSWDERREKSEKILRRVAELPEYGRAERILLYYSFRSEVETLPLLEKALADSGKMVYLPKVEGDMLSFYRVFSPEEAKAGYRGIPEPGNTDPDRLFTGETDLSGCILIVPGSVFDKSLARTGYGKGFYDRFLSAFPDIVKIGICFDVQVAEGMIPQEAHDVVMDYVITESRVYEHE